MTLITDIVSFEEKLSQKLVPQSLKRVVLICAKAGGILSLREFQREWRDFCWNVPYVYAKAMPLRNSLINLSVMINLRF